MMITHKELLVIGFRLMGVEEDDPYYKIIFRNRPFGLFELNGNFREDSFRLYGQPDIPYTDIEQLKLLLLMLHVDVWFEGTQL